MGTFGEIDVSDQFVQPKLAQRPAKSDLWVSRQQTKGSSELYVQSNVWQTGGSTGWHTHPGHSLIIVTKGTVTAYEGEDPECKPHLYSAGMGFVDRGGGHVHMIRNESNDEARTVSVQLVPAGQPRRVEARDPGNCPFSMKTD